jgi:biopolymer transport protein TolR
VIDQDPATLSTLGPRLEEIFKTRDERALFVSGAPNADFADVTAIIDIAKGAGINHIGLMTKSLAEGLLEERR